MAALDNLFVLMGFISSLVHEYPLHVTTALFVLVFLYLGVTHDDD